jgi:membrane associated rhomboid family serine protease
LSERAVDYATLVQSLGPIYMVHGGLMVIGGLLFGIAALRIRVLPRMAILAFLSGVALNLLFSLVSVPILWQTIGSTARNLGLMGMGVGLLAARRNERVALV